MNIMASCRDTVMRRLLCFLHQGNHRHLKPNVVSLKNATLLFQRTGFNRLTVRPLQTGIRAGTFSHLQRKSGSLKSTRPISASLEPAYACSWISTSSAEQQQIFKRRLDQVCGNQMLCNGFLAGSHFVTNKRCLGVSALMTNTYNCRTQGGASGSRPSCVLQLQVPQVAASAPSRGLSLFGFSDQSAWARAIAEAEKIVGYPTSFLSLRCLLSDELSNVAMQVRKLVGTKHPLVKTARNLVYDGKHNIQTRGLIILLISKAAWPSPQSRNRQGMVRGIYPSQRTLAEIAEMIHTAFLVHKGVVNIQDLLPSDGPRRVMEFGNKISVLSGDFLLASACLGLAQLRNTYVVDLISQAISDLSEAAFTIFSEEEPGAKEWGQVPLSNLGMADWAQYVFLSSGSLIAKSCRAALNLAGHEEEMQACVSEFGRNIALAQQLHHELLLFTTSNSSPTSFSLTSAPVLLHLEGSGSQDRLRNQTKFDMKKLHREVCSGSAIAKSQELCLGYAESARLAISGFPQSEAKDALLKMVKAVSG
ncbi:decaprenyl-diphosphate synthase subunit 2-like [Acanthaster planci]|uniref:Decaprenyl-diphosphate synthase subunit 2-like n=1 Tax=Acanthaster planci TaxID=133434 RepID=A0A8B7XML8_ACAPL|nr:decaprenyl-diphosphate synthase subunit 2-like [Acanthaster planci]